VELRLPPPARVAELAPYVPGVPRPLPLALARVAAGFPSPADDYVDRTLDLNELVVKNPAATYFVRVEGDSMVGAGIHDGDVLVVDRALEPADGKIVVAALDGALTVKQIRLRKTRAGRRIWLVPENDGFPLIEVPPGADFEVWGVVTHVIHALR
jgi:DNA polymerase V